MPYLIRFSLFFGIALFLFASESLSAQSAFVSEEIPGVKNIIINNDSVVFTCDSPDCQSPEINLNHNDNNILFELQPADSSDYQFRLEGFDKDWTGWKHTNFKEYTNVPAGSYTFRAKYIIKGTTGGEIPPVYVRILPIWYSTRLAFLLYAISLILIIWVTYNFLNLRFARRLYMLEQIINKRTEDCYY